MRGIKAFTTKNGCRVDAQRQICVTYAWKRHGAFYLGAVIIWGIILIRLFSFLVYTDWKTAVWKRGKLLEISTKMDSSSEITVVRLGTETWKEQKIRTWRPGITVQGQRAPGASLVTEFSLLIKMDLESVIQSEVSQKEKNKYCMLTHIYGI